LSNQPLISIVMPSYNQGGFIEAALDSILEQDWKHLEVIVQDGGSTDATLALLEAKSRADKRVRWKSAPDRGPADAINKALSRVRGTYVGWLNSDDCYAPGALSRVVRAFTQHPQWMMCYGEGEYIDSYGDTMGRYPTLPDTSRRGVKYLKAYPVPGINAFQQGCFICQPCVFFKAVMPMLIGNLNTHLAASFDFDYWLRAFKAFEGRIGFLPDVQAYSRLHEETITHNQRSQVMLEGMQSLHHHLGCTSTTWVLSYLQEQRETGMSEPALAQQMERLLPTIQPLLNQYQWQALTKKLASLHVDK